jgi:hypothetical protein
MALADKTEWEILNAAADDWESLETIYRSLNRAEQSGGGVTLGPVGQPGPLLEVVADGIRRLAEGGFLEARLLDAPGQPQADLKDLSYVWRAWFRMTQAGREAWAAAASGVLP